MDVRSGVGRFDVLRFKKFRGVRRRRGPQPREVSTAPPEVEFTGDGFTVGGRYRLELREVAGLLEAELRDLETGWSSGRQYVRRLDELWETPVGRALRDAFGESAGEVLERIRGIHLKTGVDYRSEILRLLAEHGIMNTTAIARPLRRGTGSTWAGRSSRASPTSGGCARGARS